MAIDMAPILEDTKPLAGHMPAEKIGNMRVVRKDRRHSENENRTPSEGGSESGKSDEVKQAENVLAHTGLAAQTHRDYPEEAVRHTHTKCIPKNQPHQTNPAAVHCTKGSGMAIFQPTKN